MSVQSTTVAGIVIPSADPLFLAVVGVHVLFGLACVVSGLGAMLVAKGRGKHSTFGTVYFWCMLGAFLTMTVLSIMRWSEDRVLFGLGAFAFSLAVLGRQAAQHRWDLSVHVVAMASSYIVLLTAFYVDNGKNLPLWRDLPPLAYWTVPALIGVPLILRVLARHPLLLLLRAARKN